jgi:glycosyltransferase involved in cell wall biosynthesis
MTYHNRQQQLFLTLKSIQRQYDDDIEIIIIDDASDNECTMAKPVADQFHDMDIKVTHIPSENKWWTNPSVPYNMGFKQATGEIIVITNSEGFHIGNTIEYIRSRLNSRNYLSFSAYTTLQQNHNELTAITGCKASALDSTMLNLLKPMQPKQWYNHPMLRPTGYHFLSAITKENLDQIGGFNEIFASGYCFDDDEFVWRIREAGIYIDIIDPTMFMVVHQWHSKNPAMRGGCPLWEKNRQIWISITGGKRLDDRLPEARN